MLVAKHAQLAQLDLQPVRADRPSVLGTHPLLRVRVAVLVQPVEQALLSLPDRDVARNTRAVAQPKAQQVRVHQKVRLRHLHRGCERNAPAVLVRGRLET